MMAAQFGGPFGDPVMLVHWIGILMAGAPFLLLGAAGGYFLAKRRSAPPLPPPAHGDLDRRVALLEQELAASRALVEQLSEEKRFHAQLQKPKTEHRVD